MKFSYNWLRELVPGLELAPRELARQITMKTAECEGVEPYAPWMQAVVAARVESVEPIEGSHNVKAVVDAGPEYGRRTVVCGAPNCRPGLLTAFVPPGVTVAGGKHVRTVLIQGVESQGMLASGAELGLNRDSAGILELAGVEPGAPIPGCPVDHVIEVDNKSLTHRPDLWGHLGMAREVAAFTSLRLADPVREELIPNGAPAWRIDVRDFDLCPRYSALVFENVTVGPSPLWLQARLEAIGLNPISNIVDVTNYIMAELAEPMHAFDADLLHGETIIVRRAEEGEELEALNGETYRLSPSNLVIADARGAVALAGVIGGAGSAIRESTRRIVLESANFEAACIRRTSAALKIRTDASMRFEKAQDPANTVRALARAVELFQLVSPGIRLVGGLVDSWRRPPEPKPIELEMEWLSRRLGRPIGKDEVRRILESLSFGVEEPRPQVFLVSVPSWRATRDISIKEDLLEEVGRMVGYGTVPPAAPLLPARRPWVNEERLFHHAVRQMAAAQGFTEVSNYSFISEEMAQRFGMAPEEHLRVANPISVEQSLLRRSLLPGIHKNILDNSRFFPSFRLFEIGNEIHKRPGRELPHEVPHLMAAVYARDGGAEAFFELKRLAECLMPGCETRPCAPRSYEHPARTGEIVWRGRTLGRLFELHPRFIEQGRASILDVDLAAMFALGPLPKKYTPLRRFPVSEFDLSIVAGLRVHCAELAARIRGAAGPMCERVQYLYSYRGRPLPEDRQSLTYRITLGAPDHTLSSEEVASVRSAIIAALEAAGYGIRQ
ncbi:MAG: phenylalanine--tRNA ligase subunit beta [Bryobacteraceae bacterium]|nr:phenylalanine--tRNA ligase subunit beta [Bryobacteraceae bacterium]